MGNRRECRTKNRPGKRIWWWDTDFHHIAAHPRSKSWFLAALCIWTLPREELTLEAPAKIISREGCLDLGPPWCQTEHPWTTWSDDIAQCRDLVFSSITAIVTNIAL